MSKIITTLLIIFIFHLLPIFPKVLAAEACNNPDLRITLDKDFISEGTNPKILEFTISNGGAARNLQGKQIFLRQKEWWWWQPADSEKSGPLNGNKFSLELKDDDLKKGGQHNGNLYWDGKEQCTGISYTIGVTGDKCLIDQNYLSRNPIIPGGKITIKFLGKKDATYHLKPLGGGADLTNTITTDENGKGSFDNVTIDGVTGQTVKLLILGPQTCYPEVKLSISASLPEPATASAVTVENTVKVCKKGDLSCTSAGGEFKAGCTDQGGISTAIGCIHTSPAEFAKDVLKFAIGIGGGLAFLMMLLGAYQMLTSQGNPEILKAGQERMTSAVIGLLFVIFATLFLQIIGVDILKLEGFGR